MNNTKRQVEVRSDYNQNLISKISNSDINCDIEHPDHVFVFSLAFGENS
jgi:hypothetical protein